MARKEVWRNKTRSIWWVKELIKSVPAYLIGTICNMSSFCAWCCFFEVFSFVWSLVEYHKKLIIAKGTNPFDVSNATTLIKRQEATFLLQTNKQNHAVYKEALIDLVKTLEESRQLLKSFTKEKTVFRKLQDVCYANNVKVPNS